MTGNVLKEIEENIKDYEEQGIEQIPLSLVKYWISVLGKENKQLKHFKEISDNITKEVEDFFEKHEFDTVNFNVLDEVFDDVDYYYEKCIRLNKENEQLKHRLAISEKANFVTALAKENEQLKKENNKLHQRIFEMRTNVALDRTEISRQSYTPKEFLDKIEKW